MKVFNDIKTGLNQAIDYEKNKTTAKITVLEIVPPDTFNASEIREIRMNTGLTQKKFAAFMGVSVKTIEAWESGRNHPEGSSCRLLTLTKNDPLFPKNSGIVTT